MGLLDFNKKKEEEEKLGRGFVRSSPLDGTSSTPSPLGLMQDDAIASLRGFDPEAADVFQADKDLLGPNSQPSARLALQADEDAFNYYTGTVMPTMDKLDAQARDIKSRRMMGGFSDYLPLIAASLVMDNKDATSFIQGYLNAREGKFKNEQELAMYDLQMQAQAMERVMKMHDMKSQIAHKAYAYGKETLHFIQAKLSEKQSEFALSKLPVVDSVGKKLGQSLFQGMIDPAKPTDLSKEAVLKLITEEASRFNIAPPDGFSDAQLNHLHMVIMKTATEYGNQYMDAFLKEQARKKEGETDFTLVADWIKTASTNHDSAGPYQGATARAVGALNDTNNPAARRQAMEWDSTRAKVLKEFEDFHSKYMKGKDFNLLTSEITKIASINPGKERDAAITKLIASINPGKERDAAITKLINEHMDTMVPAFVGVPGMERKYWDSITAASQVREVTNLVNSVEKVAVTMSTDLQNYLSSISQGLQQSLNVYNTNMNNVMRTFLQDADNYLSDPELQDFMLYVTIEAQRNGLNHMQTAHAIGTAIDPVIYNTISEKSEEVKVARGAGYQQLSLEDRLKYFQTRWEATQRAVANNEPPALAQALNSLVMPTAGDRAGAGNSRIIASQLMTALDSTNTIRHYESYSDKGVNIGLLPIYNIFGAEHKGMSTYLLQHTFSRQPKTSFPLYMFVFAGK